MAQKTVPFLGHPVGPASPLRCYTVNSCKFDTDLVAIPNDIHYVVADIVR